MPDKAQFHWKILLTSRKAQLAVVAVIMQAVRLFGVDANPSTQYAVTDIVNNATIVLGILILGIAHEDNGAKKNGGTNASN